jgi:cytochrome c oxidase subunit II
MKSAVLWILLAAALCVSGLALWRSTQDEADASLGQLSPAARSGAALAETKGCRACHSLDGAAGIGPSWMGSYGSPRTLQDGSSVVMDDDYLRRSMQDPAGQVVTGFDNVMVPVNLSDAEVDMLIGLIKELGTGKSP